MACRLSPSEGEKTFKALEKAYGREKAVDIFVRAMNPRFLQMFEDSLELDADGVPTFDSLLENPSLIGYLGEQNLIAGINAHLGINGKTFDDTSQGVVEAYNTAENINKSSRFNNKYIVTVDYDTASGKHFLRLEKSDDFSVSMFYKNKLEAEKNLAAQGFLTEAGFSHADVYNVEETLKEFEDVITGVKVNDISMETLMYIEDQIDPALKSRMMQAAYDNRDEISAFTGIPLPNRTESWADWQERVVDNILSRVIAGEDVSHLSRVFTDALDSAVEAMKNNTNLRNAIVAARQNLANVVDTSSDFIKKAGDNSNLNIPEFIEVDESALSIDKAIVVLGDIKDKLSFALKKQLMIIKKEAKNDEEKLRGLAFENMLEDLANVENIEQMFACMYRITKECKDYRTLLSNAQNKTMDERFNVLKEARDYLTTYAIAVKKLSDYVNSTEFEDKTHSGMLSSIKIPLGNLGNERTIGDIMKDIRSGLEGIASDINSLSRGAIIEFATPSFGHGAAIKLADGSEITFEDALDRTDRDISITDRWLDSLANSNDLFLQTVDQILKKQKHAARLEAIKKMKALEEAARAYTAKTGSTDFSFMYREITDEEGNVTGVRYKDTSGIDWELWDKVKNSKYMELKNKIMNDSNIAAENKEHTLMDEWMDWKRRNAMYDPKADRWIPRSSAYETNEKFGLTEEQRAFADVFWEIKSSCDAMLPELRNKDQIIYIHKNLAERIKSGMSFDAIEQAHQSILDSLASRSDDTDTLATRVDANGNRMESIACYYRVLGQDETEMDMSRDLIGTMSAYILMAENYGAMDEICTKVEFMKDYAFNNRVTVDTVGKKTVVDRFYFSGNSFNDDGEMGGEELEREVYKERGTENWRAKLQDCLDSQMYLRYMKPAGVITVADTDLDMNKVLGFLGRTASFAQLGFNWLAGIANAATGICMENIEAVSGRYFTKGELLEADKFYAANIAEYVSKDIGSKTTQSMLGLINELFDVKQDYDTKFQDNLWDRDSKLYKLFGPNLAFLQQGCGDHWLYSRAALAILGKTNVKYKGKECSILDVLEVENFKDGKGARLKVKDGTTTLEGKAIKDLYDKNDAAFDMINRTSQYIAKVNQDSFGIYNKMDQVPLRRLAAGKLVMQYRDWIKPAYNKRFQRNFYNMTTDKEMEGYYRTMGRFSKKLYFEALKGSQSIAEVWDTLNEDEKKNCKAAIAELAQWGAITALATFAVFMMKSDDKDKSFWKTRTAKLGTYIIKRLSVETGALVPGVNAKDMIKIVDDPCASASTLKDYLHLYRLLGPANYLDEKQSGMYKGHSTAFKTAMDIVPLHKQVYRLMNPEKSITFLDND